MKILDIVKITKTTEEWRIDLGLRTAWVTPFDGGWAIEYEAGGYTYYWQYLDLEENVEISLWEWLCTLSKCLRADHGRLLGSFRTFRAA